MAWVSFSTWGVEESDDGNRWWTNICIYIYINISYIILIITICNIYIYIYICNGHTIYTYIYVYMYICHNFMWLRWIRWMTDCFQLTIFPKKTYVGWYREGGCIIVAASMVILVAVDHTSFAKWGSTSFRFSLVSLKSAALWGAGNEVCLKTKSPKIHWRKCESSFSVSKGYLIGKIWEHT